MTPEQTDRFLDLFERAVKVAERVVNSEYPERDGTEAEVYSAGSPAEPNSPEEYEEFEAETLGRFESRFTSKG